MKLMDPTHRLLLQLLAQLRGLQWSHWNSHWKVKGDTSYGDHLLFERLYTSMTEEIDTLGEKIITLYGSDEISDTETIQETVRFLSLYQEDQSRPVDLYRRALRLESHFQRSAKKAYERIKELGAMSLGLDDFLMSVANAHETSVYLLTQRTR